MNRPFRVLTALIVITACSAAFAADWPHWRGTNYDGTCNETGFKTTWKDAPKKLWEFKVGDAYSSFSCVDGRLYTCGTKDEKQVVFCFDAKSGKVLWQKDIEEEYKKGEYSGPRCTPTVDDGFVYVMGALGQVLCLDAKTGRDKWTYHFDHPPEWGYSASILIYEDMAVIMPGASSGSLCMLDKKTGRYLWKAGKDSAGYATPLPFEMNGRRYICGFSGTQAVIVDPKTRKIVLTIPWHTDYEVNAAAPIYHDGYLFLSSGYHTGCGVYKLTAGADGKLSSKEVWNNSVLLNRFQSAILYQGDLYSSDEKGLKCVDFLTGKLLWEKNKISNGTLLLAGDQLILLTDKGSLQIAKASPRGFEPTAMAKIFDEVCWSAPILVDGKLYARDLTHVACIDLKQ